VSPRAQFYRVADDPSSSSSSSSRRRRASRDSVLPDLPSLPDLPTASDLLPARLKRAAGDGSAGDQPQQPPPATAPEEKEEAAAKNKDAEKEEEEAEPEEPAPAWRAPLLQLKAAGEMPLCYAGPGGLPHMPRQVQRRVGIVLP